LSPSQRGRSTVALGVAAGLPLRRRFNGEKYAASPHIGNAVGHQYRARLNAPVFGNGILRCRIGCGSELCRQPIRRAARKRHRRTGTTSTRVITGNTVTTSLIAERITNSGSLDRTDKLGVGEDRGRVHHQGHYGVQTGRRRSPIPGPGCWNGRRRGWEAYVGAANS
jgi:hypothetical protein